MLEDERLHAAELALAGRVPVPGHLLEDSAHAFAFLALAAEHHELAARPLADDDRRRLVRDCPRRVLNQLQLLVESQLALRREQVPELVSEAAARQLHCADLAQGTLCSSGGMRVLTRRPSEGGRAAGGLKAIVGLMWACERSRPRARGLSGVGMKSSSWM